MVLSFLIHMHCEKMSNIFSLKKDNLGHVRQISTNNHYPDEQMKSHSVSTTVNFKVINNIQNNKPHLIRPANHFSTFKLQL